MTYPDKMKCLVQAAREYLNTPFRHQGRSKTGLDCAGLVVVAARDIGIEIKDVKGYGPQPDGIMLKRICDEQFVAVPKGEFCIGDVLLMKFIYRPQHFAIVTDKGIIHAYSDVGKVVEHTLDDKWRKRIVGAYRIG